MHKVKEAPAAALAPPTPSTGTTAARAAACVQDRLDASQSVDPGGADTSPAGCTLCGLAILDDLHPFGESCHHACWEMDVARRSREWLQQATARAAAAAASGGQEHPNASGPGAPPPTDDGAALAAAVTPPPPPTGTTAARAAASVQQQDDAAASQAADPGGTDTSPFASDDEEALAAAVTLSLSSPGATTTQDAANVQEQAVDSQATTSTLSAAAAEVDRPDGYAAGSREETLRCTACGREIRGHPSGTADEPHHLGCWMTEVAQRRDEAPPAPAVPQAPRQQQPLHATTTMAAMRATKAMKAAKKSMKKAGVLDRLALLESWIERSLARRQLHGFQWKRARWQQLGKSGAVVMYRAARASWQQHGRSAAPAMGKKRTVRPFGARRRPLAGALVVGPRAPRPSVPACVGSSTVNQELRHGIVRPGRSSAARQIWRVPHPHT